MRNDNIPQMIVPFWEPTKYGEDIIKSIELQPISDFVFVNRSLVNVLFPGTEKEQLRPIIAGPYIIVPQMLYIAHKNERGHSFTQLISKATGMLLNDIFILHTECYHQHLQGYDRNIRPIYKTDPTSHWVENTYFQKYFTGEGKANYTWLAVEPTSQQIENFRSCAIMAALAE